MNYTVTIPNGSITVVTGREGPSHNPYQYMEITLDRLGKSTTIHRGLTEWVKSGSITAESKDAADFLMLTGYSPDELLDWVKRARNRPHSCGNRFLYTVQGYPGESLLICHKCGEIVDSEVNLSAII